MHALLPLLSCCVALALSAEAQPHAYAVQVSGGVTQVHGVGTIEKRTVTGATVYADVRRLGRFGLRLEGGYAQGDYDEPFYPDQSVPGRLTSRHHYATFVPSHMIDVRETGRAYAPLQPRVAFF